MANQPTTGTNPSQSAYSFISISTLEKRIRRHLARQSQTLIHTKAGTAARLELGEYAVYDQRLGGIVIKDTDLSTLAHELGVIAETEVLDLGHVGWLYHIARQRVGRMDGKLHTYHLQLTKDYTTEAAARQAAEALDDKTDLVLVGWDASGRTPA